MKLQNILHEVKSKIVKEKHDLSGAPDEFKVPNVTPSAKKFENPNEVDLGAVNFLDTGPKGWEADANSKTASAVTLVDVDDAKKLEGKMGENRKWRRKEGKWWFGNLPLRHENEDVRNWQSFVNDIAENGLDWPITVSVTKWGEAFLREGNHRLAVYDLLDIPQIPTHIWWWGNVQGTERDPMKEYFEKAFK